MATPKEVEAMMKKVHDGKDVPLFGTTAEAGGPSQNAKTATEGFPTRIVAKTYPMQTSGGPTYVTHGYRQDEQIKDQMPGLELTDTGRLAKRITAAVAKGHGFEPRVLLRSTRELESAIKANPFPEADAQPKALHLFFLDAIPKSADWTGFDAIKTKTERFKLVGDVLYLYTPDGFGISKLAAKAEKLLGVAATARNWRTVTTLHEMASQY